MLSNGKHVERILFSIVMVLIFFSSQIVFSPQVTAPQPALGSSNHYIIITNYTFYDEIKVFAEWKEEMGLTVEIVNDTEIYGLYPPSTPHDKAIHLYLTDHYNNRTTNETQEYVLLVGDWDKIPIHWTFYEDEEEYRMGENYFSYEGSDNIVPDWKLGRWSVNNISDLRIVRNKTIDFQKNPPRGSWKNNITLIASDHPNATWIKESIRQDYIEPSEYGDLLNVTTIYAGDNGTKDEIEKRLNNGSIVVNYNGEGSKWGWNFKPGFWHWFTSNDTHNLINNEKLSFVFSVCCSTGKINYTLGDCMGEAWLKNPDGGGVGFIGNAEYTPVKNQSDFDREMFKLIYENGTREMGEVFTQAKVNLINKSYLYTKWLSAYLLLGDPHTNIYYPELVNEDFSEEPGDWDEEGEIATHNSTNQNIFVESYRNSTNCRYSKNHTNLTIEDDIFFEFKFTVVEETYFNAAVFVGDFNEDETTNRKNTFTILLFKAQRVHIVYHAVYIWGYYSDGTPYMKGTGVEPVVGNDYLCKVWLYGNNRTIVVRVYSGGTYVGGTELKLSISKTFTTNDFGVGNPDDGALPTWAYKIDYDDAYLSKVCSV
jgi:hypothetical protein